MAQEVQTHTHTQFSVGYDVGFLSTVLAPTATELPRIAP